MKPNLNVDMAEVNRTAGLRVRYEGDSIQCEFHDHWERDVDADDLEPAEPPIPAWAQRVQVVDLPSEASTQAVAIIEEKQVSRGE